MIKSALSIIPAARGAATAKRGRIRVCVNCLEERQFLFLHGWKRHGIGASSVVSSALFIARPRDRTCIEKCTRLTAFAEALRWLEAIVKC